MTTLEDIEQAVANLSPEELRRFRVWFEQFEATRFDQVLERDALAGKLDKFAEEALAEFRQRRTRKR